MGENLVSTVKLQNYTPCLGIFRQNHTPCLGIFCVQKSHLFERHTPVYLIRWVPPPPGNTHIKRENESGAIPPSPVAPPCLTQSDLMYTGIIRQQSCNVYMHVFPISHWFPTKFLLKTEVKSLNFCFDHVFICSYPITFTIKSMICFKYSRT